MLRANRRGMARDPLRIPAVDRALAVSQQHEGQEMDEWKSMTGSIGSGFVQLDDLDQLVAAYRHLGVECLQLSPTHGADSFLSIDLPGIELRAMNLSRRVRLRGTTLPGHVTLQIDRGSVSGRYLNGELLADDGIAVARGSANFELVTSSRHRGMNFTLSDRLIMDALAERAPGAESLLDTGKLHIASASAAQVAAVRRTAAAVVSLSGKSVGRQVPDLASSEMIDVLVGAVLARWYREGKASFHRPHYQRMPVVRRAEEFMRANLGTPIMLQDICRAARASERTVGYAFCEVYGVGPKQFLRMLRLHEARRELKTAADTPPGIEEIAHNSGLWHTGHFRVNYRELFGETPQETRMARAPRPLDCPKTLLSFRHLDRPQGERPSPGQLRSAA